MFLDKLSKDKTDGIVKFSIKMKAVKNFNSEKFDTNLIETFPKYTSQLINLANQNGQGTRPKVVGQLSELFPKSDSKSVEEWRNWYVANYPDAIDIATDKVYAQIQNLQKALPKIDKSLVRKWVEDLVINKTFNGLYVQDVILDAIAKRKGENSYRRATPSEEKKGIDGYVGNVAYSIKPITYKSKDMLNEQINVTMVYYTKTENELAVEIEE